MLRPLVKKSLPLETLEHLRDTIERGEFGNYLLPERQLSVQLGISRPTLRAALLQLEREGLLSVKGRSGRSIVRKLPKRRARLKGAIVRMLQNNTPSSFLNEHLQIQEHLAEHLRGPGVEFHVETAPACFSGEPDKALEALVRSRATDLWVLYLTSEATQKWFQSAGINCVILGSSHVGITFPSIDEDYRSTCRHAAGTFLARGHDNPAILISNFERPGDRLSLAGFEEAIKASRRSAVKYFVASHDETVGGVCRSVDMLLNKPDPPTGWLILNAQTYLTVFSHLAGRGLQTGRHVSLICRNSDPYFDSLVPGVAHYQRNLTAMSRRLLGIVRQAIAGEPSNQKRWLVGSQFREGNSLRPLKAMKKWGQSGSG